ncbi:2'-hydroxyisoflavone reductase [Thermocatellispora tengchongensis]|uniref:2'-hydroxyisoflavone reductase n=1 Tax=Thermocatellispora tengchongensis TaxID=1073253 RepID=A0A840PD41_9ACTN|nr:NAD-dependent epimerase/dehydratase family protein [Thermocatellispora tengchongensis]MBB5135340.1 2'-hydroxyisoflavone reductase [Thermocatellispora tengchongensis]
MKVLIIGGSVFLGRAITQEALRRGHEVTTFNRGVSGDDLPGAEAVRGDREVTADLERLAEGRTWDAVIDVCGFVPRVVGESVRVLSGRAATYAFISSISAIADFPAKPVDETSPLHPCEPDAGPDDGDYGALKAGCERAVEQGFAGNTLIIVPGLIIGPYENVGRLPWWLTRIARGGQVLAPGDPNRPIQLIDARDIAAFTLDRCEAATPGRFLTSGVQGNTTFGEWLALCARETGSNAEFVWADDAFLLDHGVQPWSELPLWAPDTPGFDAVWLPSSAKALAAGLRCRPVAETVRDTWAWLREIPEEKRSFGNAELRHGIDPQKEAELLDAWLRRAPS